MLVSIYRGAVVNMTVKIAETSQISQKLNAEHICKINFESDAVADILIGDYIVIGGATYALNLLPNFKKTSSRKYAYSCIFESRQYELSKILYSDGIGSDFFLTGDLDFFIDLIITNLNRVQSGWTKGTILAGTETKNLQFTNENCLEVLQRLCDEYDLDFRVNENKSVDVGEFGTVLGQSFSYGKGKGLYTLERKTIDSKNLFTRLYAYGGERNIPANYRDYSPRLKITIGIGGDDYIEQNVSSYGVIEAAVIFDEIYPRFKGPITYVGTNEVFRCSSVDFDLNSYLIAGTSAKIHFNTGALAGYEFELTSYSHATREFTLKYSQQEKTYSDGGLTPFILPNDSIKPAIGDEFVILDITMPAAYVTSAENELLAKATEYLSQNCDPRVNYSLDIDPRFMEANAITINIGDYIQLIDTALSINKNVRVIGIEKSVYSPVLWKVDLSDYTEPQIITRMQAELEDVRRLVVVNKLSDIAKAKRNWKTAIELRDSIFDPDGYFDAENIKPLSIETAMLSVGTRAGNFTLSSTIEPNYNRDPSQIRLGGGVLAHFQIEESVRTWTITQNIVTSLVSGTTYYIYARCNRSGSGALLLTDTVQRQVDSDPAYYYFPVGILSSVIDGWRDAIMTYGQSYLVGRQLNVGRIVGVNGLEINLDTGTITGAVTFSNGYDEDDVAAAIEGTLDPADLVAEPVEQTDIISHYAFDETVGAKLYDTIGGVNGSTINTRNFEEGVIGRCLVTGVNNCYGFLNELLISGTFSVAFWINGQTTWNVSSDIITSTEPNGIRISTVTGTRQIIFRVRNSSSTETTLTTYTPADIDTWHHCALVFNNTTGLWYVYWDGVQVATGTNPLTRSTNDNIDVYLGWNLGSSYLISRMDELYFCRTALTAKKVKYLFGLRDALMKTRTQTVIDGGIITSGRIELGDASTIKAGITGGGTLDTEVRIWAGATFANRGTAPFRVLQDGKVYATAGAIGGWNLDTDAIYAGVKSTADGYAASGFTIAGNGAIHTPRFFINPDGAFGLRSATNNKRVEIDSANNRFDLYNSSGLNVVRIDDTIAGLGNPGLRIYAPEDSSNYATFKKNGFQIIEGDLTQVMEMTHSGSFGTVFMADLPAESLGANSNLRYLYVDIATGQVKHSP